jgi:hypothetical protein
VLLAVALLLVLAPAAFAEQRWQLPAQTLSDPGQDATENDVAVSPGGNAVAVWTRFDGSFNRVEAAFRLGGGTFGAVQTLSAAGQNASEPQVAMDAQGNAIAVWSRFDGTALRVQAAYAPSGGPFGAVQTVSSALREGFGPRVAMSDAGEAIAVWSHLNNAGSYIAQASIRPPGSGSSFGSAQDLSATGADAFDVQVDVAPDGNALAAWYRPDASASNRSRIQVASRPVAGAFGAPATISPSTEDNFTPQVAMISGGTATVVWYGSDGVAKLRVESASRSGLGAFGSVQTLSDTTQDAATPQVDIDPSGNAVAVWIRSDGTNDRAQAAARPAAGTFGSPQTISDPGQSAGFVQVDVDPRGNALAAWYRSDGTNTRIQVAARPPGGSFGTPETISDAGRFAFDPHVDASAFNAVATWYRRDGVNWRIQSAPREEVPDAPRSAISMYASLVPSYRQTISATQCTASGRAVSTHGAPLSVTSCNPPAFPAGTQAFFGAKSRGYVKYFATGADVAVISSLTDLQNAADDDYDPSGSDITIASKLRMSDRGSSATGFGCSPNCPATVQDFDLSTPVNCIANSDPTTGSNCSVVTSFNSITPGMVAAGAHSALQVFRIRLRDSGANGTRGDADDREFGMTGYAVL